MLSLYNTLNGAVEPVDTTTGSVSLYVCGVTPYDTTHLGHAFTYVAFDVLVRYLRSSGVRVRYAQNVTDIDDDILRKAKERQMPYDELAKVETARFVADMRALNVLEPDHFIPATSVMERIVEAVSKLLGEGSAYSSGGNIYFDNTTFPGYGAPIRDRQTMVQLASEHGGNPEDPNKRDPLDFLLWQKHAPGEPSWPSPFGPGRPGWHIECSTIALTELGIPVDIHGGGSDLIFPHHASEIAQAETITHDYPFVRHWMHTAMVRMDGEKMSKSLGNMVFVGELLKAFPADAIRLYLLSHHYREPFEWDLAGLTEMDELCARLREFGANSEDSDDDDLSREFRDAMDDDLHADRVVEALVELSARDEIAKLKSAAAWAAPILGLTFQETMAVPA